MAQGRYRHRIIDAAGDLVTGGVSTLEPPPSIIELVKENKKADAEWKKWLNNQYEYIGLLTQQVNQEFITPTSINVVAGGTPVGSVTDVQTLKDGNYYQVPEVAATPGFNIEFDFTNIASISGFVSMIRYTGSATHDVTLGLYDYVGTAYDRFLIIPHTATLDAYRTVLIPDDTDYIDSSNNAQVILYHESSGIVAHNIYIDYIAIIGRQLNE